jgi:hypothetical protein
VVLRRKATPFTKVVKVLTQQLEKWAF